MATAHPRHHMTLRMERRDTRISGPRTHSACDGPGAVPLLLYARPSLGPQTKEIRKITRLFFAFLHTYIHLCTLTAPPAPPRMQLGASVSGVSREVAHADTSARSSLATDPSPDGDARG